MALISNPNLTHATTMADGSKRQKVNPGSPSPLVRAAPGTPSTTGSLGSPLNRFSLGSLTTLSPKAMPVRSGSINLRNSGNNSTTAGQGSPKSNQNQNQANNNMNQNLKRTSSSVTSPINRPISSGGGTLSPIGAKTTSLKRSSSSSQSNGVNFGSNHNGSPLKTYNSSGSNGGGSGGGGHGGGSGTNNLDSEKFKMANNINSLSVINESGGNDDSNNSLPGTPRNQRGSMSPRGSIMKLNLSGINNNNNNETVQNQSSSPRNTTSMNSPRDRDSSHDISVSSQSRLKTAQKITDALEEDNHHRATSDTIRRLVEEYCPIEKYGKIIPIKDPFVSLCIKNDSTETQTMSTPLTPTTSNPSPRNSATNQIITKPPSSAILGNSDFEDGSDGPIPEGLRNSIETLLKQNKIGRSVMAETGIGMVLRRFKNTYSLIEKMKKRVQRCIRLGVEIESNLFNKHLDKKINAIIKEGGGNWKYNTDCRSVIWTLKQTFNIETRERMIAGTLTVPAFLNELDSHPESFSSPNNRTMRQSMLEDSIKHTTVQTSTDSFAYFDEKMECIRCGQKEKGCKYSVLYYDSWGGYRSRDNTRSLLYKCMVCGAEFQKDE